ncbi:type IV pilin protein [Psychrosphaera aestuarii]|uniref:type IV pilin protein n=1 Tax=Psychrosphaera aestuarii TaxID=1266052 RepID=UPI001FD417B4|nr:type IV pilin protein [Psychrosphaera aestuarii]
MFRQFAKGFTLVEMLVTLAIIGILSSVIYPSYTRYVVSSYRAQAQADMLEFATAMERHKATTFSYAGAAGTQGSPADTGEPWIFAAHSPSDKPEADKKYTLTIEAIENNGRSYEIKATPVNQTYGDPMSDGVMSIFSDGRKAYDANKDGNYSADEYCWNC